MIKGSTAHKFARIAAIARLRPAAGIAAIALLSACSGGGGPQLAPQRPTPTPPTTPSPTPTPPNTTVSTSSAEYRRSDGPEYHGAVTAWRQGATGAGETIAIVDTGIDLDNSEFAGRISNASTNVASPSDTAEAEDDHGTNVALVAAGGFTDSGVIGIAYEADLLVLRGDDPGSCASGEGSTDPLDGCFFTDSSIAQGIDIAVAEGAAVINLSLGGGQPNARLRQAVANAAAAGVVVIVAAGNDGDSTEDGIDPSQPDPFGAGLLAAGGGNVIIAGSVDENGNLSAFSNRAGDLAASYLTARGEGICCVYENGTLKVETEDDGSQFVFIFSGTSFATPQISGAVALMAQAFPNLTGAQIVEILLDSARDAGDPGTDALYGRGILDIAAAFSPSGTTSLAGGTTALPLADSTGAMSSAMGDAASGASINSVIQDEYGRAFNYDVGRGLRGAAPRQRLSGALSLGGRRVAASGGDTALAFTFGQGNRAGGLNWENQLRLSQDDADQARVLAARAAFKIAPDMKLGFAFKQSAQGLVAQLQGQDRPAFMIAASASGDTGFLRGTDMSLAMRRQIGKWGLTLSAETGEAYSANILSRAELTGVEQQRDPISSIAANFDRSMGRFDFNLGATLLSEDRTIMGARFHDALGANGADTVFLDAGLGADLGRGYHFGAGVRQGFTRARGSGMIVGGSEFVSRAWSIDFEKRGFIGQFDTLGFRLSQPLRVSDGGLNLDLPISYDYAADTAIYGVSRLSLSPEGREIMGELAWRGPLLGGEGSASAYYRRNPGHFADAPADQGVALRWSSGF